MWQAINPESYVVPKIDQSGTYTEPSNFTEDVNTSLKPFHQNVNGEFWTSANVVKTETFQYAYPETQEWKFSNNQAYQSNIRTAINALYSGNSPSTLIKTKRAALPPTRHQLAALSVRKPDAAPMKAAAEHKTDVPALKANPEPEEESKSKLPESRGKWPPLQNSPQLTSIALRDLTHLAPNGKYTEWIVNVRAAKHVLGQTYSVHVFLGDFNADPLTWPFENNLVGTDTILGRPSNTRCGKCKDDRKAGLMVTGIVPLTAALIEDVREGLISSLNPEDVVPYLAKNLHWRVTLVSLSLNILNRFPLCAYCVI